MDLKAIFGGVSIGKDTSRNIMPSIKGLAVRVSDEKFVVKEGNTLADVNGFIIDGGEKYVYRLPVNPDQVRPGDLLVTSDNPFQPLFVTQGRRNGTLRCLDPLHNLEVDYIPPTNMFNVRFFVKAISLVEGLGGQGANNLLPLLALSGGLGGGESSEQEDGLTTLLLLQTLGGQAVDMNRLLPLFLLKGSRGDSLETLLLMQALGINLGNLGGGQQGAPQHQQAQP